MPIDLQLLTFLRQATTRVSRSTTLHPLGSALGLTFSALCILVWRQAPAWLIVAAASSAGVLTVAYLVAYFYFMITDPSALRTERFLIEKMQLERSQLGDSSHGFNATVVPAEVPTLPAHNGEE